MTEKLNTQIDRAGASESDIVWNIIDTCSKWLETSGMSHWTNYYTKQLIDKKLSSQEVYIAKVNGNPVAAVTLDQNPVDYYEAQDLSHFEQPEAAAIYVTALAVLPEKQKQGLASQLVTFAETTAKARGIKYIRFDCRASYEVLVNFYQKRGYCIRGTILDTEDNNEPYYLMEKQIT
jgi:ribosomal protein S18 acetylase RimI-like enzyme